MSLRSQRRDHNTWPPDVNDRVTGLLLPWAEYCARQRRYFTRSLSPKLQTLNKQQQPNSTPLSCPSEAKRTSASALTSDSLAHQWTRIQENKATNTSPISWTRSLTYLKIIQDVCLILHTQNHPCKTLQINFQYSAHPFRRGKGFLG